LKDEATLENVTKIIGSGRSSDDAKLVTRAAMALDPAAPLRHKGLSAQPDGIGPMLAVEFSDDQSRLKISDMINAKVVSQWM
jgi:hypothetical protein